MFCPSKFNWNIWNWNSLLSSSIRPKSLPSTRVCVSRSESQGKIHRILNYHFKPRRGLLFVSEAECTSRAFEAILRRNRGVLRGVWFLWLDCLLLEAIVRPNWNCMRVDSVRFYLTEVLTSASMSFYLINNILKFRLFFFFVVKPIVYDDDDNW